MYQPETCGLRSGAVSKGDIREPLQEKAVNGYIPLIAMYLVSLEENRCADRVT